ncbi:MAG: cell division protein ZapA [Bacteroidales bacterium]|jgi:cell division protein ZapA (FtsZ GTPase activity inhibitor)|nr:cell division protein ZapA [Bacteroidales bacterium]
MEQSITIKIAGKDYPLKATSPEMEQLMRLAAETINQKLAVYDAKFPDKTLVDKLSFVALNETVSRMSYQKRLSSVSEEAKRMLSQTNSYLDNIDKK